MGLSVHDPYARICPSPIIQERTILYGVDVTGSISFQDPTVLRAVEFAAEAHKDQRRKTGEPYVSHCIEAALIVENMLPPTQLKS